MSAVKLRLKLFKISIISERKTMIKADFLKFLSVSLNL